MPAFVLTDLRHFLLLAEELHFGRTAERIGVAQPVLSRRIRRLEEAVGTTLLDRSSRSVALTRAGRRLVREAGAALAQLDRAMQETGQQARPGVARLRVGFVTAFEVPMRPVIERWRRQLHCEVELAWLPSARQVALLRRGALDLGFLRPPATHAGLDLAVLRHEGVVCAMTERHRLARAGTLAMQALQGERLVGFGPVIGTLFQRRIEAELRRRHVHTQPGPRAADTRAVLALVAMGDGVALLPRYVADEKLPGLAYVPVADLPAFIPLAIACRANDTRREVRRAIALAEAEARKAGLG